jgi:N-acyl-D-aspartate/D-glutamate deacylase
VRDRRGLEAIRKELQSYDLRNLRIASAPKHHFLLGKTIKQIADNWGIDYIDAIRRVADITDLSATIFYADVSSATLRNFFGEERALITADMSGGYPGAGYSVNQAAGQAFANFLRGTASEGLLSLEDAIKKVTSVPADLFGINNRGVIDEGMIADLVVLSKDNYEVKNVILGGKVFGEEALKGEVLNYYR